MKHGKDVPFVPGKSFKFLGQMDNEELRLERSKTKKCPECGQTKQKKLFEEGKDVCLRCDDF